ncbi:MULTISPECIES: heme-degrading domain-containing protein [Edwardsiella]|uniref:UPF0303 protein ETEE_3402 n=2 Tax=Edwardsiella anguillarum TaxID=1821960 RepID=A0A076LWH9_9GAMM|nr:MULTISPECIES: heme-degrading domain-containing protein [Edwardsiella]AKM48100.1 hypothetical protein QY76_12905 [Edwardsiella sp. EA181011]GAJ68307.1 hypothetical protein MA13_contig00010-0040 [Edwardsiella piscicida]AIJ09824.1 Hypothetical protein ETEE_3402 [Edwardsiella anguillarum ET080813]AKR77510.1 heme-degrading domain-containing protein [Edwardsiella sp. LADL05-105]KAB0585874.1 heme-degrading domain-containing protein [Edwardsiella anguillarum]
MSSEEALARLAAEEQQLQFPLFNPDTAWQLGCALRQEAEQRGLHVTIDIQFAGQTLFHCAMPGTSPDNAEWIRRKRNVVLRFQRSSYAMGMRLTLRNTTLEAFYGLDPADYASQGGSFPLRIVNCGCVGAISVSGAPQLDDHLLVSEVIARFLGISQQKSA